jgi:Icc-related predicted phosphoesterase
MRVICCSDTHGKHKELKNDLDKLGYDDNTIIIHAGDSTNLGKQYELLDFLNWFGNLPYKYKIFIAGNHDFCFEPSGLTFPPIYPDISQEFKDMGIIYLMDQMIEIEGVKIYGSPWQPEFYNWAFNVKRGEAIAQKWANIPENLDILITHGGPYGILDVTLTGMRVGCEELYKKIMKVRPKIQVFGHIHFSYGYKEFDGMSFVNAASLGENYLYENKPIMLTLDNNKNIIDITVN